MCAAEKTTTFAEIALDIFEGFKLDGTLADSWRNRLSIKTDEHLFDALAYIRRSLLTLEMEVKSSERLNERTKSYNLEAVRGLISFTELSSLMLPAKSPGRPELINTDKLHALANLHQLLEDEFPRPVLPAGETSDVAKALMELISQIEQAHLPPLVKDFLRQQAQRLYWAVKHASILGADATLAITLQVFGTLRNPRVPEEAEEATKVMTDRLYEIGHNIAGIIDAAEKNMKRGATVLAASGAVFNALISPAL